MRLQDATALRAALLAKLGRSVREPSGGLTEIRKEIRELRMVGAAHEVSERKAATAGLRELAKYRREEAASNSGGGSRRRKVAPTSRYRGRGRAAAKPRIRRG